MKHRPPRALEAGAAIPCGDLVADPAHPDGPLAVRVKLHPGAPSVDTRGRYAILDYEDWQRIQGTARRWYLLPGALLPVQAPWHITGSSEARDLAHAAQRAAWRQRTMPNFVLARLVMQAKPHEVVRWRTENRLDLRRRNLMLMDTRNLCEVPASELDKRRTAARRAA